MKHLALLLLMLRLTLPVKLTPLDDYVNDNSDIKVFKYMVMSIKKSYSLATYRLNVTSLKWFDGNLRTSV
jgi:hypothetical protein